MSGAVKHATTALDLSESMSPTVWTGDRALLPPKRTEEARSYATRLRRAAVARSSPGLAPQ